MHPRYGRRLPLTHDQGLLAARASYMVPSLTIVIAMLLHGLAGPRAVPFFISEADYTGLDGLIFTVGLTLGGICLLYTSPSPRDLSTSRMPSSA